MHKPTESAPPLHELATHLGPDTFEPIYHTLIGLKFPVDVAQVLELRYLINHAVDDFPEPPPTQDYREFRDALRTAMDSFGIENKRHSDRLLRILTMMRDLHYTYSIESRNRENELRETLASNRRARTQSIRYGMFFTFTAIISGIIWVGLIDADWPVKLLTAGFAVLAWTYLQAIPGLDRDSRKVERQLNDMLRHRVKSIHWRLLIQKLSLVLGYKRITGVEVFRIDSDIDYPSRSHVRH